MPGPAGGRPRTDDSVLDTVRHFFEADNPVAALCHGPQILAAAGVLEGREMTAYPAVRADVEAAGCSWVDGVATDGSLVTGQDWSDHPEWLSEFLGVLGTTVQHGEAAAAASRGRRPVADRRWPELSHRRE